MNLKNVFQLPVFQLFMLLTFYLGSSNMGLSQNAKLDSLRGVLENFDATYDSGYVDIRLGYIETNIFAGIGDSAVLAFTTQTQAIANDIGYKKGVVKSIQRRGVIYQYFFNKPLDAIIEYQLALDLIGNNNYLKPQKFESFNNLANIYLDHNDFEKALDINMSLIELGLPKYGKTLHDIGNIYVNLGHYDSAVFFFRQSIDTLSQLVKHQTFTIEDLELATAYVNLCFAYIKMEQMDSALQYFDRSISLINQYNIGLIKGRAYINASEIYFALNDLENAEAYAGLAEDLLQEEQNVDQQRDLYFVFHKIYSRKQRFREALDAYERAVTLSNVISSKDRRLEVDRKVMEYEARQKELIADQELQQQRFFTTITIIAGVALLLVLIAAFLIFQARQKARVKAREAQFREDLVRTKLIALRSQLNPHFIFNALGAINQYNKKRGIEEGEKYLIKFSKLIRSILENSDDEWVTLEKDLELTSWYMDIESLRLDNGFSYNIKLEDGIDGENIQVPSLLLQPFIENSFRHGLSEVDYEGQIDISIEENNGLLKVSLEDNGKGMDYESTSDHHSMGVEIIKRRIQQVSSLLGRKGTIDLSPGDNGIKVLLAIPYKHAY